MSMSRIFYRQAHIVFLCYDVTDENSFDSLVKWVAEVEAFAPDAKIYLIGNKTDMADRKVVSFDQSMDYPKSSDHKISKVFQVSAKTGDEIQDLFATAAKELYEAEKHEKEHENAGIRLEDGKK